MSWDTAIIFLAVQDTTCVRALCSFLGAMPTVRMALESFFYRQSGVVFGVDFTPDDTIKTICERAIEQMNASSNQTERTCFENFVVRHQGVFIDMEQKMVDVRDDNVFYIRNVVMLSSLEGKLVGIPLCVFFKGANDVKPRFKDGYYPVFPNLTIKQMKHYILGIAFGVWGSEEKFWHNGGEMFRNRQKAKTVLKNGDVVIVSSTHVNIAEDYGSPILRRSDWRPSASDFALPASPAPAVASSSSSSENESDFGGVARGGEEITDFFANMNREHHEGYGQSFAPFVGQSHQLASSEDEVAGVGRDTPPLSDDSDEDKHAFQKKSYMEVKHWHDKHVMIFGYFFDEEHIGNAKRDLVMFMNVPSQYISNYIFVNDRGNTFPDDLTVKQAILCSGGNLYLKISGLKGGAPPKKGVMRTIAKGKNDKKAFYKSVEEKAYSNVNKEVLDYDGVKDAIAVLDFMKSYDGSKVALFTEAMTALNKEQLEQSKTWMEDTTNKFGSTEDRIEKICRLFFGKHIQMLENYTKNIDNIITALVAVIVCHYTEWAMKDNGKYDNKLLVGGIDECLKKFEKGDTAPADLTNLFAKMSV